MQRLCVRVCLGVFGISLLACRPVLAIGWEEIVLLLALLGFLFGPPLFRLYRRLQKFKSGPHLKKKRNE
ncbi:MAG: hypothetical protein A2X25_01000 [Chloroflexi bacterium GWB2_49_20]|nr:MAG: hypothetical protein A2X25_01000 [Chloroflexi bacterium GWB2_49_20]OGN78705.1 MAG: hypothetical protein A2X26_07880 [Chloroflexi bacterium GWC2_49_37]OGN85346.1 MAG: hypothetical protein A2X27_03415 [Chloroflexi bacterium GWD2_49_16]HBG73836.1 hypothetical protein [Anaerolineae bacterium]HCC79426.1 hypothetical protein [Anaerolineae bacterium]